MKLYINKENKTSNTNQISRTYNECEQYINITSNQIRQTQITTTINITHTNEPKRNMEHDNEKETETMNDNQIHHTKENIMQHTQSPYKVQHIKNTNTTEPNIHIDMEPQHQQIKNT